MPPPVDAQDGMLLIPSSCISDLTCGPPSACCPCHSSTVAGRAAGHLIHDNCHVLTNNSQTPLPANPCSLPSPIINHPPACLLCKSPRTARPATSAVPPRAVRICVPTTTSSEPDCPSTHPLPRIHMVTSLGESNGCYGPQAEECKRVDVNDMGDNGGRKDWTKSV